jgi:hypothetical protein
MLDFFPFATCQYLGPKGGHCTQVLLYAFINHILVEKFQNFQQLIGTKVKELLLYLATLQHNIWQPRNIKLIATQAQTRASPPQATLNK